MRKVLGFGVQILGLVVAGMIIIANFILNVVGIMICAITKG